MVNLPTAQKMGWLNGEISTLREYGREIAVFAVSLRSAIESSGGSLPSLSHRHDAPITYPVPSQEAGKALNTALRLRASMGCYDRPVSNDSGLTSTI
ncbi:hypothetical protein EVAR_28566_1 [Eumeta japonica]|uniref:Uncharacterized protein n=1 Tax=Eumeta variegata TaxID=151549 RepID=A0A4C1UWV6_EUMVA|nr:hypothetical protein EVAR_28566_1 [Eumeta japonica]